MVSMVGMGSGTSVQHINQLLNDFRNMKKMLRQMNAMQNGKMKAPRGFNPMQFMK
jgi:signal recognition particle subunit SRP54